MKNPFKNRDEEIREWRKLTGESPKVFFDELKEEYQGEYLQELTEARRKAEAKNCPKCGAELFPDSEMIEKLAFEFWRCEICQLTFDYDTIEEIEIRFKKILELMETDEWMLIKNWFDYTQNVSDEYMTDEELKLGEKFGF